MTGGSGSGRSKHSAQRFQWICDDTEQGFMSSFAAVAGTREFVRQAGKCRTMGSSFVASVLEAADRQLSKAPMTHAMVSAWPGDMTAAAVALRVNGALHALARRGTPQYLTELYDGTHGDFDGAVATAFAREDQFIAEWIRSPTQTNEVARAGAVMAALMAAPLQRPMPFQLLELGSSCGLNLNLSRYAYKLGGALAGDPLSAVRIEPEWRGPTPPITPVSVSGARGVDLQPLNASNPAHRERLLSFAWADQPARSKRLEEALQIAVEHPPRVDRGDAVAWLADRLSEPQEAGTCRVIVHSMVLQYLGVSDRQTVAEMIDAAGARASQDRPLLRVSFEWTADRRDVELRLSSWPNGGTVVLARCDPYGDWLEWLDPASARGPGTAVS